MKLAILGADRQALDVARTLAADATDGLVVCCDAGAGPYAEAMRALPASRAPLDDWEALLDQSGFDA
ncbi:MAG TPA: hypothetical protein VMF30_12525, partial [Pirellulales bacterium]|nr:hypothetical protein [Pirellulales bacterium]